MSQQFSRDKDKTRKVMAAYLWGSNLALVIAAIPIALRWPPYAVGLVIFVPIHIAISLAVDRFMRRLEPRTRTTRKEEEGRAPPPLS